MHVVATTARLNHTITIKTIFIETNQTKAVLTDAKGFNEDIGVKGIVLAGPNNHWST